MKCPACGTFCLDGADECDTCQAPLTHLIQEPSGPLERRILDGTVASLQPKPALSVAADATVAAAVRVMRDKRVGCLLVVDRAAGLRGVVSERELLLDAGDVDLEWLRVADVMRPAEAPVPCDQPLADAFHQMAVSGNRHLPVALSDGRLGVVSARDLLRYLCR